MRIEHTQRAWEEGLSAHLHLGLDCGGLSRRSSDDGEATRALAVEAHVLGIGLGTAELVAICQEDADRLRVARAVPAREALQC